MHFFLQKAKIRVGVESQGIWYFLEQPRTTDVYPITARAVNVFLTGRNEEVVH